MKRRDYEESSQDLFYLPIRSRGGFAGAVRLLIAKRGQYRNHSTNRFAKPDGGCPRGVRDSFAGG
jgi:hypothetical protein